MGAAGGCGWERPTNTLRRTAPAGSSQVVGVSAILLRPEDATKGGDSCGAARLRLGEEDVEVTVRTRLGLADSADDLVGPSVHAGCALRRGRSEDDSFD